MDDEVEELIEVARASRDPHAVERAERAVRLADLHGDLDQRSRARQVLVVHATFAGDPRRALGAFAWCIARADEGLAECPQQSLLWLSKWIVATLGCFPAVRRDHLDAIFTDVQRRFRDRGFSPRPLRFLFASDAWFRGDAAAAASWFAQAMAAPRDALADCAACEADAQVRFLRRTGRPVAALDAARVLESGALRCEHVPARTWPDLALSAGAIGEVDRARRFAELGLKALDRARPAPHELARLAEFLARDGAADPALDLLESGFGDVLRRADPAGRMRVLAVLGGILARDDVERGRIRLPVDHPLHVGGGQHDLAAVAGWCAAEADRLAAAFDARDGTDARAARLAALRSRLGERWE